MALSEEDYNMLEGLLEAILKEIKEIRKEKEVKG